MTDQERLNHITEDLGIRELQRVSVERCTSPDGFNHVIHEWSPLEWAGAMAGEAGEAANIAKKMRRGDYTGREAAGIAALADEIADVVCYAVLLAARVDVDLASAIRKKFNKSSDKLDSKYRL